MADDRVVLLEEDDGIFTVTFNRPEKRNAMNPPMHEQMHAMLSQLKYNDKVRVLIITGAGESFCAGQDLKEYFYLLADDSTKALRERSRELSNQWRSHILRLFPAPTIAMVNGYCFGGGFTQLIACDFVISSNDATYGLSEVNWGSFPGGLVSRILVESMNNRDALFYIMTGDTFDGPKAVELGLANASYPAERLREETVKLAEKLMSKNPATLRLCKEVFKHVKEMDYKDAEDYMWAKMDTLSVLDPGGRQRGIQQFVQAKSYKPGFTSYEHDA